MLESALTQDFADPLLCKELHYAGLTDQTPYHWHQDWKGIILTSFYFDPEGIYQQAFKNRQSTPGIQPIKIIPAYRTTELDRIIPAYAISKEKGCYITMLDTLYGNAESKSPRLPDALATLLIKMLKARIINIDYCNQQFIINKLPHR
jgi:hypothetical protein